MKLVLFDIDGTLLDSGGAGVKAMNAAFCELFSGAAPSSSGMPFAGQPFKGIKMAGKTDAEIVAEALSKHGIEADGRVPVFMDAYIRHLGVYIENSERRLKPGVREALNALSLMRGAALGLLTGNIEKGARIKLEPFGLNGYFPVGAFGSDSADRNSLLPIALERFNRSLKTDQNGRIARLDQNGKHGPEDCVVVGDTPRDVECAKLHGARAIAVATGRYTAAELLRTEADHVMEDLSDTPLFLRYLGF
ncbi:MAG: HAD family hydrolase [Nitrospiraceae bacterium]|nr:HAD family hydrolase [Nitrospiraceae bacterium]